MVLSFGAGLVPGWLAFGAAASAARGYARLLRTDRLTGLANRDGMARAFDRAGRRGPAVGVLLVDLDRFKQVNDTHGHEVGNRVLRHAARQIALAAGPGGLAVRLHGDEFAVLLTGLPLGAAGQRIAERVAVEVAYFLACPLPGLDLVVTGSVGLAIAPAGTATLSALLRAADQRMYATKNTPRRTTHAAQVVEQVVERVEVAGERGKGVRAQ